VVKVGVGDFHVVLLTAVSCMKICAVFVLNFGF